MDELINGKAEYKSIQFSCLPSKAVGGVDLPRVGARALTVVNVRYMTQAQVNLHLPGKCLGMS